MKKFLLIAILACCICSCTTKITHSKDVVNEFLTEINDPTKELSRDLVTPRFLDFLTGKSYYASNNWELTVKPQSDSVIEVDAKGHTNNSYGQPVENLQSFVLTNEYGGWKIFNSYKLVEDDLDFKIVNTDWDFFWDRDKDTILKQLQNSLELKVLVPGYNDGTGYSKGNLKFINNSDYDIEGVNILIEHFDYQGNSVNTDHWVVPDIIRQHGYREFEWLTSNCEKCYTQKFKINFLKESN